MRSSSSGGFYFTSYPRVSSNSAILASCPIGAARPRSPVAASGCRSLWPPRIPQPLASCRERLPQPVAPTDPAPILSERQQSAVERRCPVCHTGKLHTRRWLSAAELLARVDYAETAYPVDSS